MAISNGENEQSKGLDKFGKVIDALHNKNKLSALRTYQGDMAEFIKEKNESVISVAVKEKKRKEEREKKEKLTTEAGVAVRSPKRKHGSNLILVLVSLLLIAAGFVSFAVVGKLLKEKPAPAAAAEKALIPYNDSVTLAVMAKESLGPELLKLPPGSGIKLVKVPGWDGQPIRKAQDFFDFLQVSLPPALSRNLKEDYAFGLSYQENRAVPFLIITVSDFGGAFAGMLDWEAALEKDLDFLSLEPAIDMTSLLSTSTIPWKIEQFGWKDVIVKNKDTRALLSEKGKSKIAYTFLDRNTLLIAGNISAIGEISSIYASRAVAR